jgi:hypothetical protein
MNFRTDRYMFSVPIHATAAEAAEMHRRVTDMPEFREWDVESMLFHEATFGLEDAKARWTAQRINYLGGVIQDAVRKMAAELPPPAPVGWANPKEWEAPPDSTGAKP